MLCARELCDNEGCYVLGRENIADVVDYGYIAESFALNAEIEERTEKVAVCQLVGKFLIFRLCLDAKNGEIDRVAELLLRAKANHNALTSDSTAEEGVPYAA